MSNKEKSSADAENTENPSESIEERRKRLKQILASGGMFVGAATMQKEWSKPVIDSVILPAHAQTSAINGSYTASADVSADTELLDFLVPQAHAGGYHVLLCINVVNNIANLEVTVEDDWWLYTGSEELDFDIVLMPDKAGGGKHNVSVTGKYSEANDTISGFVTIDGLTPQGYTAVGAPASCVLIPPVTPPPTTTV